LHLPQKQGIIIDAIFGGFSSSKNPAFAGRDSENPIDFRLTAGLPMHS